MTRPSNSESSRNKFKVFDFDGNDDPSENMHKRFSAYLRNMKNNKNHRRDSPINKYNFLQTFASGTEIADQGFRDDPIDVDGEGCQCTCSVMYSKSMRLEDGAVKESDAYFASGSSTQASIYSTHINVPIGAVSSETSNTEASTSPTSTFCLTDNEVLGKQLIELDCSRCEIAEMVQLFPYVINSLKLEGSSLNGTKETFCFEWTIRDIILIESGWTAAVETAMVNLHLKSNTSKGAQNGNKTSVATYLSSYDATTHFESTVQDVLAMYHKITGKALDLSVDLSAASAAAEE